MPSPKMPDYLQAHTQKEVEFAKLGYRYTIYCLYCPSDKQIKYIGITASGIRNRLATHDKGASSLMVGNTQKNIWFAALKVFGLKPMIRPLRFAKTLEEARLIEAHLINTIGKKRVLLNREFN